MKRAAVYFCIGFLFMLLQTLLFPRLLPLHAKPELLLILIVYLGLNEDYLSGGVLAYLLGNLLDVFAASHPGLHGFTLLLVFFAVRGAADRLNTESSLLLLVMVGAGTVLHATALGFSLVLFAEAGPIVPVLLLRLFPQVILNVLAAVLLIKGIGWLNRQLPPHLSIPAFRRLDSRYES